MIRFILNDRLVETGAPAGSALLDFIRYGQHLTGTKIGCREGDCGACTVLEGKLESGSLAYRSLTSCLSPLGNAHGKHIVTIEGLNMDGLSPVQQAFTTHNATQCGFCTPGFVVALSGYAISAPKPSPEGAVDSMNGNICRCTGYKSIERAAVTVARLLAERDPGDPLGWLVGHGFLPGYFRDIPGRLAGLASGTGDGANEMGFAGGGLLLGGGTDLLVQRPDEVADSQPLLLSDRGALRFLRQEGPVIAIGAASTASDIMQSPLMQASFPRLRDHFRLVSSEPIRNMGTLGGNLVNASPIGDLSVFFLALDARLELLDPGTDQLRELDLKDFFMDYKKLALREGELVAVLRFTPPGRHGRFNFEKVSKRTHLDIASVNSAILLQEENGLIGSCHLSFGGVSPVPLYARETSAFLAGKRPVKEVVQQAAACLQEEIRPISDVRGSEEYKRLLARQLLFAHFDCLYPGLIDFHEPRTSSGTHDKP
jgi:xanthine dehydrogenase small subunit